MATLAGPVVPSRHALSIVSAHQGVSPRPTGTVTLSEGPLRRRARRQGLLLLAFSSVISLSGIAALLSWIF